MAISMWMRYAVVIAIVAVIGGVLIAQQLASDDDSLGLLDDRRVQVGQPAPDFALVDARDSGASVRLSDFEGQTVVLNFWASWCPPCVREFPELAALHRERDDLVVLGVDFRESAGTALGFAEEHNGDFEILLDSTGDVTERYGLRGLPGTFFLDADGIVRHFTLGPVFDELLPEGVAIADAATADDASLTTSDVASELVRRPVRWS